MLSGEGGWSWGYYYYLPLCCFLEYDQGYLKMLKIFGKQLDVLRRDFK